VLTAREGLIGLAKARFDNQLLKTNKALLEFVDKVAQDDFLFTRLPDKVKKLKWAKPRKIYGKTSVRLYTGAEAAEITANRAQQSDKVVGKQLMRELTPNDDDDEIIMPITPPGLAGESQGGSTVTLALRTPERLHYGPDLTLNVSSARETEPAWQLSALIAPPSLGLVDEPEGRQKRKRQATIRYQEGREDGHIGSVGLSQSRI
jgi:hypothetical protein